jgi:hypothetical protein
MRHYLVYGRLHTALILLRAPISGESERTFYDYVRHARLLQAHEKPGQSPGFSLWRKLNAHHSAAHSHRSATSGSTFVARRAGIQQANSATSASNHDTSVNVTGKEPEGGPGHIYRLRLAHMREAQVIKDLSVFVLHP